MRKAMASSKLPLVASSTCWFWHASVNPMLCSCRIAKSLGNMVSRRHSVRTRSGGRSEVTGMMAGNVAISSSFWSSFWSSFGAGGCQPSVHGRKRTWTCGTIAMGFSVGYRRPCAVKHRYLSLLPRRRRRLWIATWAVFSVARRGIRISPSDSPETASKTVSFIRDSLFLYHSGNRFSTYLSTSRSISIRQLQFSNTPTRVQNYSFVFSRIQKNKVQTRPLSVHTSTQKKQDKTTRPNHDYPTCELRGV